MANVQSNNINFSNAYNSKAMLILDKDREKIQFWLKEANIPNITLSPLRTEYPEYAVRNEGNVKEFGDLTLTAFIDENFTVYEQLYNWLIQSLPGEDYESAQTSATIMILNNSMTKPVVNFNFSSLFITELPEVAYNNYGTEALTLSLSATFDKMVPDFVSRK